jgi:hypothetical protein
MKRVTLHTAMSITLFATLYLYAAPTLRAQDDAGCSNASVAGKWGFTTSGTVVGIGPRDSLGIFTLDSAGKLVNGKATASLNGTVTDEIFSGTYSVNPDCTGKLSIEIFDLSGNELLAATLNLVFDDNVRELRAIFTSAVVPNGPSLATVITVQAKRLFSDR